MTDAAGRSGAPSPSGRRWWKLNVHRDHVAACIEHLVFGVSKPLREIEPGDVLLLQTTLGSTRSGVARIRHALLHEATRPSRPKEGELLWGRRFDHMLTASEALTVRPFNLEDLDTVAVYRQQGQIGHQPIDPHDVDVVRRASGLLHLL